MSTETQTTTFQFDASTFEGNLEQASYLGKPYVGPATFRPSRVVLEDRPNPQDASQVWDSIQVTFELPGNVIYTESFYKPTSQESAQFTWRRIGHLLNHTAPTPATPEELAAATDWDQLRALVQQKYADAPAKEVQIKVVGEVYNGRPRLRLAPLGFVAEPADTLDFSQRERQNNAEWQTVIDAAPTPMTNGNGNGNGVSAPAPQRVGF